MGWITIPFVMVPKRIDLAVTVAQRPFSSNYARQKDGSSRMRQKIESRIQDLLTNEQAGNGRSAVTYADPARWSVVLTACL